MQSKFGIALLTILAAASAAAMHFIPSQYSMYAALAAAALQAFFAHYGVTFAVTTTSVAKAASKLSGSCLALCLAFIVAPLGVGCTPAALQGAETIIAELATWIADAANALTIAERTAAQFQLPPDLQAKFDDADRRARELLAAASAADSGAKDLTQQQLADSFQQFARAWTDIEQVFASARVGRNGAALHELPTPLCVKAVRR